MANVRGFASGLQSGFGMMQDYYQNQRQAEREEELFDIEKEQAESQQELTELQTQQAKKKLKKQKTANIVSQALYGGEVDPEDKKFLKNQAGIDLDDFKRGEYKKVQSAFDRINQAIEKGGTENALDVANTPEVKNGLSQALKPEIQKVIGKEKTINTDGGKTVTGTITSAEVNKIVPFRNGRIGIDLRLKMKDNETGESYVYTAPVTHGRGTNDNDNVAAIDASKILDRMKGISIIENARQAAIPQESLVDNKYNQQRLRGLLARNDPDYAEQYYEAQQNQANRAYEMKKMLLKERLEQDGSKVHDFIYSQDKQGEPVITGVAYEDGTIQSFDKPIRNAAVGETPDDWGSDSGDMNFDSMEDMTETFYQDEGFSGMPDQEAAMANPKAAGLADAKNRYAKRLLMSGRTNNPDKAYKATTRRFIQWDNAIGSVAKNPSMEAIANLYQNFSDIYGTMRESFKTVAKEDFKKSEEEIQRFLQKQKQSANKNEKEAESKVSKPEKVKSVNEILADWWSDTKKAASIGINDLVTTKDSAKSKKHYGGIPK